MPRKTGRPTKFTPETITKLKQAIAIGATYEDACNYAGISHTLFGQWRQKAEDGDPEFLAFLEQLKQAEGQAVVGWLAKIESAANDGQWQAAAWKLERRHPHKYGKTVQEIQGSLQVNSTTIAKELINEHRKPSNES